MIQNFTAAPQNMPEVFEKNITKIRIHFTQQFPSLIGTGNENKICVELLQKSVHFLRNKRLLSNYVFVEKMHFQTFFWQFAEN